MNLEKEAIKSDSWYSPNGAGKLGSTVRSAYY